MTPRILIVAGSDSGGGAGIQADIKTVTMLGGHAMTAVTAITAQNTLGVQAVHAVPTEMVVAQMRSCLDDIGVDAIKIGMIGSAETAHAVADVLEELCKPSPLPGREGLGVGPSLTIRPSAVRPGRIANTAPTPSPSLPGRGAIPIVFDPVMVATSGSILADADTIAGFDRLMRLATVVTPNLPELEILGGRAAVLEHGCYLLEKGGHRYVPELWVDSMVDLLFPPSGATPWKWTHPKIETRHTHGTGCTLASGIACGLGQGIALPEAVARAIGFVDAALKSAPDLGAGHGPMGHGLGGSMFDKCRA
jgi:hydroxymethylpyrimidine/phosphomethylpyrimidine kinase